MKYDAFISYRHSELDMYVAKKIHKSLETFRVPRAIRKKSGKKNIKRVFRDQEELPIGSDLGNNIFQALENSEFLIVVCSPRTKDSYWVLKEIETFIGLHGREQVLAILIEGEPDDSFPELLLQDEHGNSVEPLAADIRGKNKKEMDRKMKTELMRLAAPLLHCSYDDLRQRHRERRMRKMIAGAAAVAILGILFGAYSSYNAMLIQRNLREKQINQSKYMAAKSLELLEYGDRESAALIALEAMPGENQERPYVATATLALSKALRCYDTGNVMTMDRILKHELPVSDFTFNIEGTQVASIDQGEGVYAWDLTDGKRLLYVLPEISENGYAEDVKAAALTKDGNLFIARANSVTLMDMSGEILWKKSMNDSAEIMFCEPDLESDIALCESMDIIHVLNLKDGSTVDTIYNTCENSFTSTAVFSKDGTKCAIAHYVSSDEKKTGNVSVYDFSNKSLQTYEVGANYIEDIQFTTDNQLVVMSADRDALIGFEGNSKVYDNIIEKIDILSGEVLWQQIMTIPTMGMDLGNCILKTKTYQDELTGETHKEVSAAVGQEVRTMDDETGELVSSLQFGQNIMSFLVARDTAFGFVTDRGGDLHICDLTLGKTYSQSDISTGKTVAKLEVRNATAVIRELLSPDITVMKYHEGYGMESLQHLDSNIYTMGLSKQETYYSVETEGDDDKNKIYFYKTEDNTLIDTWIPDVESMIYSGEFIDDHTYLINGSCGKLAFYDVAKKKAQYLSVGEEIFMDYYITTNKNYALLSGTREYFVVDLHKKKVIAQGTTDSTISGYTLSEDGQKALFNFANEGVYLTDVKSGSMTLLDLEGAMVHTMLLDGVNMTFSDDGSRIAFSCTDNTLRIYDTETKSITAEIPFCGGNRAFIQFLNDNQHMIMQGDDYYIRVYDLENGEFIYVSMGQGYMVDEVSVNEKQNNISLQTGNGIVILQADNYQPVFDEETAMLYLPDKGVIYSEYGDSVYRFPYMDEKTLYQEVENQFPEASLSREEKIRFNLE